MIGAMPAITVRHDGKKGDGSIGFIGRPHKLSLHFRPPILHHNATPSPLTSPPLAGGQYSTSAETAHQRFARIFLSKRIIFQLSVLAPLVGAIILFIGLIQLTPGAELSPYGIPLIIAGSGILVLGLLVIAVRVYFRWELEKVQMRRSDLPQIKVNEPSFTDVDAEKALLNTTTETNADSTNSSNNQTTTTFSKMQERNVVAEAGSKGASPNRRLPPQSNSKVSSGGPTARRASHIGVIDSKEVKLHSQVGSVGSSSGGGRGSQGHLSKIDSVEP